jgi:hypothetical protein
MRQVLLESLSREMIDNISDPGGRLRACSSRAYDTKNNLVIFERSDFVTGLLLGHQSFHLLGEQADSQVPALVEKHWHIRVCTLKEVAYLDNQVGAISQSCGVLSDFPAVRAGEACGLFHTGVFPKKQQFIP